jgi:site-specific DNA-methyltransferase (adenine-specific)
MDFNSMKNQIICGDCLEVMKDIPDKSIDLVLTSPPYDNLRDYNGYSFDFEGIAKELFRIVKDGGVVVWVVGDATVNGSETGTSFKQALYFKEIGFNLHDTMIWNKDGGGAVGSNKCYTQNWEFMFVFSKGTPKSINLIYDKPNKSFGQDKSGVGRRLVSGEHKIEKRKPSAEFSRRNNYWYIPTERGEHPAVFPEKLAEDHILSWSNEGDTVLDPFAGSGTTLKMARLLNRNFIGIEISEKYCEIARQRLRQGILI